MAKPKPNPSFWPEDGQMPFDAHLYDVLRHGPYASLEYTVIAHIEALGNRVPQGLGLWDGLVDGFRAGILDIQDEPTDSPARLNELEERYQPQFSAATYQMVYLYAYAIGLEDAQWAREKLRLIRTPRRLGELLRALYYNKRVSRSDYTDDALPISLYDSRLSEIERFISELL